MLIRLGETLREARKVRGASLGTIAREACISGPYLLKLERGEVHSPSPRVLARVARALGISYLGLMESAGYLDEEELVALAGRTPRPHPLASRSLTREEWKQVGTFVESLVARRAGESDDQR